jgi:phytanoyl-CoA dioxygenase PhyH
MADDSTVATKVPAPVPLTELPALAEGQQRVLDGLRNDGIAIVRFTDLFDDSFWNELETDMGRFVEQTEEELRTGFERTTKKDAIIRRRFLDRAEGSEKWRFSLDDVWLRLAASDVMLDIVNSYRGQWARVHYIDNWYTVPYPDADTRTSSQRWHRDPEDAHVVKVFTYFNDVDEEAGPFEYVPQSTTGSRYGHLWPWGGKDDRYPPPEEFEAAIPPDDVLTLTGSAGTMIFCDTGGFHRGGFARTRPRILSVCSYVSPASGKGHRFVVDFDGREAELSEQARYAVA